MAYSRVAQDDHFDKVAETGGDVERACDRSRESREQSSVKRSLLVFLRILPWALLVLLVVDRFLRTKPRADGRAQSSKHAAESKFGQLLYSPAQDVLELEAQKFQEGFGWDKSIYQLAPSQEVDNAWAELYTGIIYSKIPKAQAAQLPNTTFPLPEEDGQYMVMLNVFHELHCLNMIRKRLHPEYYSAEDSDLKNFLKDSHIDHCVDSIRASLMCSADISPMVWQWWEEAGRWAPRNDIVHSCRKWENIRAWAEEHALSYTPDYSVRVEDDLVNEPF